ncbi:MarR family transcriptional regulator [Sporolactobacillus sp. THM7-4]|nr:MarR family transcriptional regulator [Sporolactobacillus sp. THM7-4]
MSRRPNHNFNLSKNDIFSINGVADTGREDLIAKLEKEFSIIIRRFRKEINELHGEELSGHEFVFLAYLVQNQPQIASSIAKHFEVTASYATMVVDKLINKGFVHRERSQKDRRIIQLTVTEKGAALYNKLRRVRRKCINRTFQNISDQELQLLTDLLAKLI